MRSLASTIANARSVAWLCNCGDRAVERIDAALIRSIVWLVAVIALLALQLALVFGHRPWLDEWQALQLALQSATLGDLMDNMRYEGHPLLWFLYLRGLGALIPPLLVLPVAAALLAIATQAMILFACPLTRAERLLLASGCFMLIEFLTISRSLTLGVFLLVATIVLWRRRWVWLAIALLPLCDFLFGALSFILMVSRWRERRLWWPGVALWIASGLLSAWSVRPAPDMIPALESRGLVIDLANYLGSLGVLMLPLQWGKHGPTWNGALPLGLGGLFGIAFLLFAATQLRCDLMARKLFWGFVVLTLLFTLLVYPLATRHLMLIALLLILLVWHGATEGVRTTPGFRLWILAGSVCGLFVAAWNLAVPFDTAEAAAREIGRRGLVDRHWMVYPDSRAQGVSALTGMTFERTEVRCMQSFIRWNYRTRLGSAAKLTAYLRHETAMRGRFYLLSDLHLSAVIPRDVLRPIARIPAGYDNQEFYLFVVGPNLPEGRITLPLCVPNQRPL